MPFKKIFAAIALTVTSMGAFAQQNVDYSIMEGTVLAYQTCNTYCVFTDYQTGQCTQWSQTVTKT